MDYAKLDQIAALSISGRDNRSFLQGQLTQDLLKLTPTQSVLAGWNNPKGRLLAVLQVCERPQDILLLLPRQLRDSLARRLQMFVLRSQVTIQPDEACVLGLLDLEPQSPLAIAGLTLGTAAMSSAASADCLLVRAAGDSGRALAIGEAAALEQALDAQGATPAEARRWQQAEIASGIPTLSQATSEAFVPQMVNLDLLGAISFSKGCYVGQEVVARTQNLGRIKRRMFRYRTGPGPTLEDGEILVNRSGDNAAKVVTASATESGVELLAVVPLANLDDSLMTADGRPLERLELPYGVPVPTN